KFAGVKIVDLVEDRFFSASGGEIESILGPAVEYFLSHGIDRLILGCTHFIFLEKKLKHMLGKTVEIVDSREGVGRQTARILEKEKIEAENTRDTCGGFFTTAPGDTELYKKFAEMFNLTPRGVL
ncbi:MAG: hypothetical protein R6V67_03775, partial [Spirochaetia bacterium]